MARSLGNMVIHLGLDARALTTGATQAVAVVDGIRNRLSMPLVGGLFGGVTASGLVGWGLKVAAQAQTAQAAFTVLTGSVETAQGMLSDLRNFAASNPLTFSGLQDNARVLLSFGVAAEQILPALQMLGDVSGGDADRMQRLSLVFGQINAAGRLMGQDLLQLINAGFNPLQEISARTGRSMVDLKKDMEEGRITFQMVQEAFQLATMEGGRFHGMLEKMGSTLSGQFAKLKDNAEQTALAWGNVLAPAAMRVLEVGLQLTDWLKSMDAATIQQTISTTAMAAAFVASMAIVPRIITLIGTLVKAFKSLTIAQAIQQALTGPKGWAVLAASLAIAAGTGAAVTAMFSEQEKAIAGNAKAAEKMVQANTEIGKSFDALTAIVPKVDAEFEKLKTRAAQITEQMRSPAEVFRDTWLELNALQEKGLLSAETYARAIGKAKEELQQAAIAARDFKDAGNVSVGAAERFTMAGLSAVLGGQREQQRQTEIAQQQLAEERKMAALLQEIRDRPAGVVLKEARL